MNKICIELLNGKKMVVELYEDVAPITVKNFLKLVDENFFENIVFHRVIKDFMCQAGGYIVENGNTLKEKRAESIVGEFTTNGYKNELKHELGVISMARTSDPNSGSSQFFLCVDNCYHLDDNYAGFGKIVDEESLKVLKELNEMPSVNIGYGFANWPAGPFETYTIKSIYRI